MDRSMGWKYRTQWLPIQQFTGLDNNGTSTISLSQGTTTMEPTSGASELTMVQMTTADEVHTLIPIPWDWNRDTKMCGRVWFIHASTDAADAPVWKVTPLFFGKQASVVELQGGAEVTVSITSPATSATDDSLEITNWTDLDWTSYIADTDVAVGITLELDALGSAGADECELLGLELMYEVQMMHPTETYRHRGKHIAAVNPLHASKKT
jgi:hypothetical protein